MTDAAGDPFWSGLEGGEIRLPRCGACGAVFFPPGPVCPHCRADRIEWTAVDGGGELLAFTRLHRTAPGVDSPVVLGLVVLGAGPRVLARVDAPHAALAIGDPVGLEPWAYDEDLDRGHLAGRPFFRAVPSG